MTEKTIDMSREEKMLQGTAWLTMANLMSRFLGALYVIPWYNWMGEMAPQANALYGMGYSVYGTLLALSTTGINTAVAKQLAKYNAMNNEAIGLSLARKFIGFMFISGAFFATVIYFGAPWFSKISGADDTLIPILRSLTLAVLVFPAMSVVRGIFQGYNKVKPNALSQLAEQFIRVIWMLLTTFFIMKMGSKDYLLAVRQSTFAAFIGMLASVSVLGYYLLREGLLGKLIRPTKGNQHLASFPLLVETFKTALPIIIAGIAIQLYQLIDQASFINTMMGLTGETKERLNVVYAYLSANPNKIFMIIVAVATSIGDVSLPLLTESYVNKDSRGTARLIINGLQMLLVFVVPALTGGILLAEPLYTFFYGISEPLAIGLFVSLLIQTLLQCLYFALASMLHAVYESRRVVRYFLYGLLIKLVMQLPSLWLFKAYGAVVSTDIALLVSIVFMYRHLEFVTRFNAIHLIRSTTRIVINTLVMAIPVVLLFLGLQLILLPETKLVALLYLLSCGGLGFAVYGYLSLRYKTLDPLIGQRAVALRRRLNIK